MSNKNIDWLKKLQLLLKALEKNGVKPGVWVELETKISGYELDFSEHDKVFEDKIASLEENVGYYKDSISRVEKNCDKLYHENKELKQRIAELEGENEKLFDYLNGITGNTKDEIKNNIKNIEKIDKKPTKRIGVIVAREINGQTYVTFDDFMSFVNDLQAEIGT